MVATTVTIIIGLFILLICFIVYVKQQHDKLFGLWFNEIILLAPAYGFDQPTIDDFEEIFWFDYYCLDMTPQQALQQYLQDN